MEALTGQSAPGPDMRILGIDFGIKKIGLAISEGQLAEPYGKLKMNPPGGGEKLKIEKIKRICEKEGIKKIIIGISEGLMAEQTLDFGYQLRKVTGLPIEFEDETLTSEEAKNLLVKIGKPKKKRQKQIDAISAALILQNYLDRKK